MSQRGFKLGEDGVARGRNVMTRHEVLAEGLGAFQLRGGGAGAEAGKAGGTERIHHAGHQRRLWSHDGQIDGLGAGELDQALRSSAAIATLRTRASCAVPALPGAT